MAINSQRKPKAARWLAVLVATAAWVGTPDTAQAQEILLTGPLAGASAVRKQKLYREGRFEIAPAVSFTLLDEYERQILFGARINYNLFDWLAIGVWGAAGPLKMPTGLSEDIEATRQDRVDASNAESDAVLAKTANNIGPDFTEQLSTMDWVAAPQITIIPFRGKIALFQSIFADTDLYFFGGPAFVGLKERGDCGPDSENPNLECSDPDSFARESRMAIAPTFGLGLTFFVNKWNAFGLEWRGLPFARNTGGLDNRGTDPDGKFPDFAIDSDDREFKFNQVLTISWGFYLPTMHRTSD